MRKQIFLTDYDVKSGELCTGKLQQAVDDAVKENAELIVTEGTYLTGTINLKGVRLILERGAVLQASGNIDDYDVLPIIHNEMKMINPIFYSLESDGLYIGGEGTLDLNARAFFKEEREIPAYGKEFLEEQVQECTRKYDERSYQPIYFQNCRNMEMRDFHVKDAPCWTFSFNQCKNIRVIGLDIENDLTIPNNDGMHFCGCSRIMIKDCRITAGDDCIALSGITNWDVPCEDVVISGCILESCSKAVSIGYMHSIVRNVTVTNCIFRRCQRGVCLMASEGTGLVENVILSDLIIETSVKAGNWWGNGEPICFVGVEHDIPIYKDPIPDRHLKENIRNIMISHIICQAEHVIAMVGGGQNIAHVMIDGMIYEAKKSQNRYLKGENCIDVSPSAEKVNKKPGENTWGYFRGVKELDFHGICAHGINGELLEAELQDIEK